MIGRLKTAAEVARESKEQASKDALTEKNKTVLKSIGAGALGLGAGTLGGYLATEGVNRFMKRKGGPGLPPGALRWGVPLATGAMGMAMGSWRAHQDQLMREAAEERMRGAQQVK